MTTCENALADHFKNCWCSELSDGTSYSNGRSSLPTTMTIVTIWICFCFQCLARRQWIMRSLLRICARTSVRSRSFWNQNPVLMSNGIHRPPQKIRNDLAMSLSLFFSYQRISSLTGFADTLRSCVTKSFTPLFIAGQWLSWRLDYDHNLGS